MIRKQLSVFLANKPGALSRIGNAFKEGNINILGITISDTVDHAVLRMVVDAPDRALAILEEGNMLVLEENLLELSLPNTPGSFSDIASKLAEAQVNIDYVYGSCLGGKASQGLLYLHVNNMEKAQEILKKHLKK